MKIRLLVPVLLSVICGCSDERSLKESPVAVSPRVLKKMKGHVPGEYIVKLKPGVTESHPREVHAIADALATKHKGTKKHVFHSALQGFSMRMSESDAIALLDDPRVEMIEENAQVQLHTVQSNAPWGLDRIDQRALPLNTSYDNHGLDGQGVTVYVVDTGIRTSHSEFEGRASIGADFVGDGHNGQDANGHGTHVAGTIAGKTFGVAKKAKVVAVRVLDEFGWATFDTIIAGLDWVSANHVPGAIANMSIGGPGSNICDAAMRNAINSGVVFALSAGNDAVDGLGSPARVAEAIVVGATDRNDRRADFSNYGGGLDLWAPGVGVESAFFISDNATVLMNGTSMASPHVAGLAALYRQLLPTATPAAIQDAIVGAASVVNIEDAGDSSPHRMAWLNSDVTVSLSDGFENGTSAWTIVDGTWSVVTDGSKTYEGNNLNGFSRATALTATNDHTIQARIKPVTFSGTDRYAMLMGRYTDTSNFYYLTLRNSNKLELRRIKGGAITLLASINYTVTTGTWYTLKLEIVGTALRGYVDGTPLIAVTDSGGLTSGKVGIGGMYAQARFDDVLVTQPSTGSTTASNPNPADNATGVDPRAILTWTSGTDAVSHDVYFGTVNPPPSLGNVNVAHYAATLTNNTTYYWRIDEHTAAGTVVTGTVWTFRTGLAPGKATTPYPWDGAGNWPLLSELTWSGGSGATSHSVYLGTQNPPGLNQIVPIENGTSASYRFGSLEPATTYYWRVDSTNDGYTTVGDLWTFTTGNWPETDFPGWPTNPSPAEAAQNVSPSTALSWTPGIGVTDQTLSLEAMVDAGHSLAISVTNPAGSRYTPPQPLFCNTSYSWTVDSTNNSFLSRRWTFRTGTVAGAPGAPTITSPVDDQYGVSLTPTITWTAATGATSYELYLCDTSVRPPNGNCRAETPYTTTGTSYTLPALNPNRLYYATIVARNSVCGMRGNNIMFNTMTDPSIPPPSGAASNPLPANGAVLSHAAPTLSWTLPAGADLGVLYVGQSQNELIYVDEETSTHIARNFSPNQTWYWRVDALSGGGRVQGPVWSFTTGPRVVPGLPSNPNPANGAIDVNAAGSYSLPLAWTEGLGATSADLYFGTSADPPLYAGGLYTRPTSQPPSSGTSVDINSCATYYWKVVEKNSAGSTAGPVWSFTARYELPASVSDLLPADLSTGISPNPYLSWQAAQGAASYSVWLGPDGAGLVEVSHNQAGTEFSPTGLSINTTYSWQIVAHNLAGDTAGPVLTFTTGGPDGLALDPSPANDATGVSTLPTLSWTPGQGSANEIVYIAWDDIVSWKRISSGNGTADPGPLLENTNYYWRVDEVDGAGSVRASTVWHFVTGTSSTLPGLPTYSTPPNDAVGYGIRPSFTWTPGSGATTHRLYLWEDILGHNAGWEFIQPDTLFIPGYLRPNTRYAWFAGEENANGIRRGPTWHFTTGTSTTNLPGQASNLSPAAGATGISIGPTLTWTAGSDATSHDVYFGTSNPPPFIRNQTSTSFTPPPPLVANTTYYWRIDERNAAGVTTGTVQSFTTGPNPCAGLCDNPTFITINGNYQSGNIGTGTTCFQTTSPVIGGNCGNFVSPRTLKVNGEVKTCNNQNWSTVPATRNGGYCIQTTAGNYSYAFFTLW
jgi:hypothetical protein